MQGMGLILNQVSLMAIFAFCGFLLARNKLLSRQGLEDLANLLITVLSPATILNAFAAIHIERKILANVAIVLTGALLSLLLPIFLSSFFLRHEDEDSKAVYRFALTFSNCGYIGLPMIQALVGIEGVFYGSLYTSLQTIFMWSYGVKVMSTERLKGKAFFRSILKNPNNIAVLIGFFFMISQLKMPFLLSSALQGFSQTLAPVSMLILGGQICYYDLADFLKKGKLYKICAFRNLLLPLALLLPSLLLVPNRLLILAYVLPTACPIAMNTALLSILYRRDVQLAMQLVTLSTLLSALTLPVIAALCCLPG